MLNKIEILDLEDGLEISDLSIRDAHETNVFDKIEKITWLEFRVKNNGKRKLSDIEIYLEYKGIENNHLGHDEEHKPSELKVGKTLCLRVPIEFPENAVIAQLHVGAHRISWPYLLAGALDSVWSFFRY